MIRLEKIKALLEKEKIQGAIITSRENIRYIAPSIIDHAIIIISINTGINFITDSRYGVQASKDFADKNITVHISDTPDIMAKAISLILEMGLDTLLFEDKNCSYITYSRIKNGFKGELIPAGDMLNNQRRNKDACEISDIKASLEIAEKSLEETFLAVREGMLERDVEATLTYNLLKNGSENGVFGIVSVCGENSALPHGRAGNRPLKHGDFLLIDFGAIYNGYYSDITRTVAIGNATDEMRKVYDIVLGANLVGIEAIRDGIATKDVDKIARDYIFKNGYGDYFVHGLGHGLGLDIHENPRLSMTSTETLKVGDVVTVEPGIYLPTRFGVRIEDVILVTETGRENLTKFPKDLRIV